jgi:hypothetical protein
MWRTGNPHLSERPFSPDGAEFLVSILCTAAVAKKTTGCFRKDKGNPRSGRCYKPDEIHFPEFRERPHSLDHRRGTFVCARCLVEG